MKFSQKLVLTALAALILTACSSDPKSRREAKDDFDYLDVEKVAEWKLPSDATPQYYTQYDIPKGSYSGAVGPDVDIRPPQQVLDLIPGARAEHRNGAVVIQLVRESDLLQLWQSTSIMARNRQIPLTAQEDSLIETDWVNLSAEDEPHPISARYRIEKRVVANRNELIVTLLNWREDGEEKPLTMDLKDRYTVNLANYITAQYDQKQRVVAKQKAEDLIKSIPISMGTDSSGDPVIIARASFDTMWSKLDDVLPQLGFEIEDKNQSQGTIEVKYRAPDDQVWQDIGVKPLRMENRKYKLLLGDLDNRTSINVTDSSGKPIPEEDLASLVPALVKLTGGQTLEVVPMSSDTAETEVNSFIEPTVDNIQTTEETVEASKQALEDTAAQAKADAEAVAAQAEATAAQAQLQADAEAAAAQAQLQAETEATAAQAQLQAEAEATAAQAQLQADAEAAATQAQLQAEAAQAQADALATEVESVATQAEVEAAAAAKAATEATEDAVTESVEDVTEQVDEAAEEIIEEVEDEVPNYGTPMDEDDTPNFGISSQF